jgi:carbamoyltransferase
MRVLGFSVGHDKGAVIIENGKVVVGITQERLSRIKHDGAYTGGKIPVESINYCLNSLGITYKNIDLFVYSTTEEIDEVETQFYQLYPRVVNKTNLKFLPHHLAHAYSVFFSSGLEEAAVIVADASGSIITFKNKTHLWYDPKEYNLDTDFDWAEGISIYHFNKNEYKEVYKKWIKYPVPIDTNEDVSLGTMYSSGSKQLVYSPESQSWPAGKLMGLASYADPELVKEAPDFVVELENDIFVSNNTIYPRVTWGFDFFSRAAVAGIYQREQEKASLILAKMAKKMTESSNVCASGGSFLNCNSNEKIIKSELFENCFFLPPSDDSGIPLGCAWYAYQQLIDIEKTEPISPYLGKKYEKREIVEMLNNFTGIDYVEYDDYDKLNDDVTYWLTQNRVIGWFQDGSEIGPRALGNRSIIASPIQKWMCNHINMDIKKREWYRPFAPAVLFEHQSEIFESDVYSPYMLVTTTVKPEWRDKIPAVTHIDNSARHQSVTPENNLKFYNLISKFYEKTNVPVLLNTSFNGPKEPIVETPTEAMNCFIENNLDFLVINNFLISRRW